MASLSHPTTFVLPKRGGWLMRGPNWVTWCCSMDELRLFGCKLFPLLLLPVNGLRIYYDYETKLVFVVGTFGSLSCEFSKLVPESWVYLGLGIRRGSVYCAAILDYLWGGFALISPSDEFLSIVSKCDPCLLKFIYFDSFILLLACPCSFIFYFSDAPTRCVSLERDFGSCKSRSVFYYWAW